MSWCTVESDPAVFTELLEAFGVKGVQVEELWALDEEAFAPLRPIYGLFFLFKWQKNKGKPATEPSDAGIGAGDAADVFFCPQTINNACGTIALLHVLLNNRSIEMGDTLKDFKAFASDVPTELRGQVLGQCDSIRIAHNSFARPEPFEIEERVATEDDDVFHFIAYTPVGNKVYEIDGLKAGALDLGTVPDGLDWTAVASTEIQRRISEYSEKEIHFNLMALVKDKRAAAQDEATVALRKAVPIYEQLAALGHADGLKSPPQLAAAVGLDLSTTSTTDDVAMLDAATLQEQYQELTLVVEASASTISTEHERREQWRRENERRRHNFVPFIIELLRQVAKAGKLGELYETAKAKKSGPSASASN